MDGYRVYQDLTIAAHPRQIRQDSENMIWKSLQSIRFGTLGLLIAGLSVATMLSAQGEVEPATLFQQLQLRETTDKAREALFTKGTLDPQTRAYLSANLPTMIEKGAKGASQQWRNAAVLAGQLRIVEAAPALAKWIGLDYFADDFTMAMVTRLETNPAAKALSIIGDPAIPALKNVLEHGSVHERFYAYLTLRDIDTVSARDAIHSRLEKEEDTHLRDLVQKTRL